MNAPEPCAYCGLPVPEGSPAKSFCSPGCAAMGRFPRRWGTIIGQGYAVLVLAFLSSFIVTSSFGSSPGFHTILLAFLGLPILAACIWTRPVGYAAMTALAVVAIWGAWGFYQVNPPVHEFGDGQLETLSEAYRAYYDAEPSVVHSRRELPVLAFCLGCALILLSLSLYFEAYIKARTMKRLLNAGEGTNSALLESFRRYPWTASNTVEGVSRFMAPVALGLAATVAYSVNRSLGMHEAIWRALAILVVTSPPILRVVIPVSIIEAYLDAHRDGVEIVDGRCLEDLAGIEAFVFDKTVAVDGEKTEVQRIEPVAKVTEDELLLLAGSLIADSDLAEHSCLAHHAQEKGIELKPANDIERRAGGGAAGCVEGVVQISLRQSRKVLLGNEDWLQERGVKFPKDWEEREIYDPHGPTVELGIASNGRFVGTVWIECGVRQDAIDAVRELSKKRARKRRPMHFISPDPTATAREMARSLGASDVAGEIAEGEERAVVDRYQNDLKPVCMIGDPAVADDALRAAQVGVSIPPVAPTEEAPDDDPDDEPLCLVRLPERSLKALPALYANTHHAALWLSILLGWALAYHILGAYLCAAGHTGPFAAAVVSLAATALTVYLPQKLFRTF